MRAVVFLVLGLVAGTAGGAPFPPAPFRIDHTFEPTAYRAHLALDDPHFTGHIEIAGKLARPTSVLWLHGVGLVVSRARAVGPRGAVPLEVSPPRGDQKLGLRAARPLPAGRWTLVLDYTGTIYDYLPRAAYAGKQPAFGRGPRETRPALALFHRTFGDKTFFYTQSEAIYARWIFPCIDEPDRKVPWQLTLDVPRGDLAASNAPVARTTALDAGHTRVEFAPTAPLPSYLIAFAVGPFTVVDAGHDTYGMPIRILTMPGRGVAVAHAAQLAPRLLDALEAYFGMRYRYPKLDLVEVPDASWAMENPGLVTFDVQFLEGRNAASVIAHELAHQWFGDLVTPRWWNDMWLNESFAEWMSQKLLRQLAGEPYDPIARRAAALYALGGGWVVRSDYDDDAELAFDNTPTLAFYGGAGMLDLAEAWVGAEAMQRALRAYVGGHEDGNVTTADLIAALDRAAGTGTGAALMRLADADGAPRLGATLTCDGTPRVHFTKLPAAMSVCVAYDRGGARAQACGWIDAKAPELALPGTACPRWVFPAAGGTVLYQIDWTPALIEPLLGDGWSRLTAAERQMLLWDTRDAASALRVFVRLARDPAPLPPSDAVYLLQLARHVPADLRPAFEAFTRARFGALARRVSFQLDPDRAFSTQRADLVLVELDAMTGDPGLEAEADRVSPPKVDDPLRAAWVTARVERDPMRAAKLLATLAPDDDGTARGLSHAASLLQLLTQQPALVRRLGASTQEALLGEVCDAAGRATVASLLPPHAQRVGPLPQRVGPLPQIDACIATRAQLEPVLRAWLGRP